MGSDRRAVDNEATASSADDFKPLREIGEGAYANVYEALHKPTGRTVVVKRFKDAHTDLEVQRLAVRELRVLACLPPHINVVQLLSSFRSCSGRLYIAFEPMAGDLGQVLARQPRRRLPPALLRAVAWQLLGALEHCHSHGVIHRDVKPSNVLIDTREGEATPTIKLCDFGLARWMPGTAPKSAGAQGRPDPLSDYVVTRWYRAPELLVGDRHYGTPIDVWAAGCTLAELALGKPLFAGASDADQMWLIVRQLGPMPYGLRMLNSHATGHGPDASSAPDSCQAIAAKLGPLVDPGLLQVIGRCLTMDPALRPTAAQLRSLPYFHGLREPPPPQPPRLPEPPAEPPCTGLVSLPRAHAHAVASAPAAHPVVEPIAAHPTASAPAAHPIAPVAPPALAATAPPPTEAPPSPAHAQAPAAGERLRDAVARAAAAAASSEALPASLAGNRSALAPAGAALVTAQLSRTLSSIKPSTAPSTAAAAAVSAALIRPSRTAGGGALAGGSGPSESVAAVTILTAAAAAAVTAASGVSAAVGGGGGGGRPAVPDAEQGFVRNRSRPQRPPSLLLESAPDNSCTAAGATCTAGSDLLLNTATFFSTQAVGYGCGYDTLMMTSSMLTTDPGSPCVPPALAAASASVPVLPPPTAMVMAAAAASPAAAGIALPPLAPPPPPMPHVRRGGLRVQTSSGSSDPVPRCSEGGGWAQAKASRFARPPAKSKSSLKDGRAQGPRHAPPRRSSTYIATPDAQARPAQQAQTGPGQGPGSKGACCTPPSGPERFISASDAPRLSLNGGGGPAAWAAGLFRRISLRPPAESPGGAATSSPHGGFFRTTQNQFSPALPAGLPSLKQRRTPASASASAATLTAAPAASASGDGGGDRTPLSPGMRAAIAAFMDEESLPSVLTSFGSAPVVHGQLDRTRTARVQRHAVQHPYLAEENDDDDEPSQPTGTGHLASSSTAPLPVGYLNPCSTAASLQATRLAATIVTGELPRSPATAAAPVASARLGEARPPSGQPAQLRPISLASWAGPGEGVTTATAPAGSAPSAAWVGAGRDAAAPWVHTPAATAVVSTDSGRYAHASADGTPPAANGALPLLRTVTRDAFVGASEQGNSAAGEGIVTRREASSSEPGNKSFGKGMVRAFAKKVKQAFVGMR
ncbi:hypothetical protein HYH03_013234 [Edaphochlamys debaryana]|uniref:Protein kinase domain-containing protein n=1 Tax=Edaphochlamys debaryana TaxID=47281 RepID=A0A835XSM2_9CHLO|nr:hypothetical protein HYH03_013234 [Edaphochlamys debaryana]|eukprot:KAG2488243.1 hypothetical protein HYH03_013234 [Edaphochlamys debaryana]